MKKTPLIKVVLLLAPMCFASAYAQDDADGVVQVVPVETFACHYNEGKGPDDLQDAIDKWNEWMDAQGNDNYFAMVATPQYYGESKMDVGWLGAAPSGAELGALTDAFLSADPEIGGGFYEAINCSSHTNFASAMIKAPPEGAPPENLVLSFSNCKINEGNDWPTVFGALDEWAAYQTEQGRKGGTWVMFPALGEADDSYDFKTVNSYANHADLGEWWDTYGNGGGWQKYAEIFGDMLDCDSARVYNARVVREQAAPED